MQSFCALNFYMFDPTNQYWTLLDNIPEPLFHKHKIKSTKLKNHLMLIFKKTNDDENYESTQPLSFFVPSSFSSMGTSFTGFKSPFSSFFPFDFPFPSFSLSPSFESSKAA